MLMSDTISWASDTKDGCVLRIHAVPRAGRNRVQGPHGDALKISLKAPPVDGKANRELLAFLAEILDLPPRQLSLLSGEGSREKRVEVRGLSSSGCVHLLLAAAPASR